MKEQHYVCKADELPPGSRKIVQIGKKSIGVFNIKGEYFAVLNLCPHQFAPLCAGKVTGYCPPSQVGEYEFERLGEIIRCPWHGWEFDIKTGRSIFNPHKVRTAGYSVHLSEVRTAPDLADPEEESVETFDVSVKALGVFVEV